MTDKQLLEKYYNERIYLNGDYIGIGCLKFEELLEPEIDYVRQSYGYKFYAFNHRINELKNAILEKLHLN